MKNITCLLFLLGLYGSLCAQVKAPSPGSLTEKYPAEKVTFKAADGLTITGDLYEIGPDQPVILLCHQARYNKYEYADIAPRLNQMGFNCLAIDQRSGGPLAGRMNETHDRAKAKGITALSYADAEPDIIAAIDYLHERYNQKVTIWGSSYSSSLVLFVAQSHAAVKAVLAFSPGDYFKDRKPKLATVVPKLSVPFFITSSQKEVARTQAFLAGISLSATQVQFIPKGPGLHGSKALWNGQEEAGDYWEAVKAFLGAVYP